MSKEKMEGLRITAVYIRVSTDDQLDLIPESQLAELQKYANTNNIIIASEFTFIETEGISGRKSKNIIKWQRI